MKTLSFENLEDIATGATILSSGGGGDPTYFLMMVKHAAESYGPISLINLTEIKPKDWIAPIGIIGSPIAETEKILSGKEFSALFGIMEQVLEKKITALMPYEMAGINAMVPFIAAAMHQLPVLDVDMMGRAFSASHMTSNNLFNIAKTPTFITDCVGNSTVIHSNNDYSMEQIERQIAIAMGSWGVFGFCPLTGTQAAKGTINKSISKSLSLGKAHRLAKKAGKDPLEAVLKATKGVHIGSGKITDIDRSLTQGFVQGQTLIQNGKERIELIFQNEYLLAKHNGKTVVSTPDILALLEQDTGEPITCERLQFGLKVNLVAIPAPNIWKTAQGLALVGPRCFGYENEYQPFNKKI